MECFRRVKAFPRKYSGGYVHKNWSFQLIVDDKVSDGNGVYSFIIFQNLELGRQCKLITRVSDTQTKWFSSSESVKDFVISPDDYNYLHIEGNDAIFNFKLEYQICYYDQKPEAPIKVQPMISDVMDNIDHSGFSDEKKIDHLIMTMEKLFVQANRIYLNVKQIRDSTPFHSDPYGFD